MKKQGNKRGYMGKTVRILIAVFCLLSASIPAFAAEEQQLVGQTSTDKKSDSPAVENSGNSIDQAIDSARQKIKEDPSSLKDKTGLGYLLLKKGSLAEAEKVFDEVLEVNGNYHEAMTGKGIVLSRMGKDQEAEEVLQNALQLNPNPVRTYYELGLLYEKRGDFAQANTEYKKGIEKFKQGRK
jgi:Flp pilus assembly protein TadD